MTTVLDKLIADHDRLRQLLVLFERELDRCERGDGADHQLMYDIAQHYSAYFNRVHHPLEDRLIEDLICYGLPKFQDAEQTLTEHAELTAIMGLVRARLDEALHDQPVSRTALIETARRYVDLNRTHMRFEEQTVFAWARDHLDAVDWSAVNQWQAAWAGNTGKVQYTALLKNEIDKYGLPAN
jgi:hemerythrin-like domain-containing protein